MIKVDLSKVLSPRLVPYLVSVIPGLFFEASIVFGAPKIAQGIISDMRQVFSFPPYDILICFIASGFVLGHVFIQLAWFAELLLSVVYWAWQFGVRITFGSYTFYMWLVKIQQSSNKRGFFIQLFSWAANAARMPKRYESAQPAMKCLGHASKELLKMRYGIDVMDSLSPNGEEWNVWYSVLGKPLPWIKEAIPTMRASLGCGLAGFFALPFAPSLRTWYFLGACSVFAVTGLYMTWNLLRWKTDPVKLNYMRLQSVLLDLAEVGEAIAVKGEKQD